MLAKDKATAEDAQRNAERQRQLFGQNAASAAAYDQARFAADAAAAAVQADKPRPRWPGSTWTTAPSAPPSTAGPGCAWWTSGNVVKANEGSLLVINGLDPIYADFTVNEGDLAAVRENMAKRTLKTLVKLPTDHDRARAGKGR